MAEGQQVLTKEIHDMKANFNSQHEDDSKKLEERLISMKVIMESVALLLSKVLEDLAIIVKTPQAMQRPNRLNHSNPEVMLNSLSMLASIVEKLQQTWPDLD